jgi:hypothetical protein
MRTLLITPVPHSPPQNQLTRPPPPQAKFDRIVLESLQISGGGQMEITGLNVRVR